jgi:hypothetical protein
LAGSLGPTRWGGPEGVSCWKVFGPAQSELVPMTLVCSVLLVSYSRLLFFYNVLNFGEWLLGAPSTRQYRLNDLSLLAFLFRYGSYTETDILLDRGITRVSCIRAGCSGD